MGHRTAFPSVLISILFSTKLMLALIGRGYIGGCPCSLPFFPPVFSHLKVASNNLVIMIKGPGPRTVLGFIGKSNNLFLVLDYLLSKMKENSASIVLKSIYKTD